MNFKRLRCRYVDFLRGKSKEPKVNILKLLSPVLLTGQCFGLRFYTKKIRFLLQCLIRGVVLALLLFFLYHEIPSMEYWESSSDGLHVLIVKLDNMSWWFCHSINFWLTTFKNNKLNRLIDKIRCVNVTLSYKTQKKIFRFNLIHLSVNVASMLLYNVIGHDYTWPNTNHDYLTSKIYFFGDMIMFMPFLEFLHLVYLVGELFKQINLNFKRIEKINFGNDKLDAFDFRKTEIIRLRQSHLYLTEICVEINVCYSEQLLVVLCYGMIQAIYAVRSIIGDIHLAEIEDSFLNITADTFWFIPFFMSFIQMILFCEKATTESSGTLTVIHRLINIYFYEEEILQELELFATQVQRHRLRFHVRFFDLHYHFLNVLVSSLMTYFVVIATFQGESDNGKLKSWDFNTPSPSGASGTEATVG